jgi:hypothetical protein
MKVLRLFAAVPGPRAQNFAPAARLFRAVLVPMLTLTMLAPLTGCYTIRIRRVARTTVVSNVLSATAESLVGALDTRYDSVTTLFAAVEITASEGGAHTGEVKDIPTFSGAMYLRKPADLRILLQLPVVRSRAFDMVADGKNFKLLIPPRGKAYVGSELATSAGKSSLENVRPSFIRDAMLIPPVAPDEFIELVNGARIVPPEPRRRDADGTEPAHKMTLEEPDYDLTILRAKKQDVTSGNRNQVLERVRVIHISRITLLPYEQDVYEHGVIVTKVEYDRYEKVGGIDFPMSIVITRPVDELKLTMNLSKMQLNQPQSDDTYTLDIPEFYTIQKM